MNRPFKPFILLALFSVLSLGSATAFSQDVGLYAGVNFGQAKVKDICLPGLTSCDDTDTAFSIFGGYQFNTNFAFEIAYTDLGKATVTGPGGTATIDASGLEFSIVGTIPISQQFALYGKAGIFLWDANLRGVIGGVPVAASDDGNDLTIAIGARFSFTRNVAAQLQWQRYMDVAGADVDVIGVGLLFRF